MMAAGASRNPALILALYSGFSESSTFDLKSNHIIWTLKVIWTVLSGLGFVRLLMVTKRKNALIDILLNAYYFCFVNIFTRGQIHSIYFNHSETKFRIIHCLTYKILSCSHWVAHKEDLFLTGLLQNVINNCRVVLSPSFVPTIVPEVRAGAARVEVGVISGISVAPYVHHPNIIAYKIINWTFFKENLLRVM